MKREEPNQLPRSPQYIQAAGPIQQISLLLRAVSALQDRREVESIASLLLACLTSPDGLGCPRAVLLMREPAGGCLRGHSAMGIGAAAPAPLEALLAGGMDREGGSDPGQDPRVTALRYDPDEPTCRVAEAVRRRQAIRITPRADLGEGDRKLLRLFGSGAVAAVPLIARKCTIGVVVVELDDTPDGNGEAQLQSAQDIALHGANAFVRREGGEEDRAEADLFATIHDISRACLSANRLDEVLKLVLERATNLLDAAFGIAWLCEPGSGRLRMLVRSGREASGASETLRAATARAEKVIRERKAIRSAGDDPEEPAAAFLCVPLIAFDEVLGAIALLGRGEKRQGESIHFTEHQQRRLDLLGSLAAAAVKNARLFDRVRESGRRLQEAERLILHTEKLAALGEMSAKVAHEIRTPLSAIGGFARRIEKALPQKDPNRSHASIIVREIKRLEAILGEQLQLAKTSKPRMRMVNLRTLVRETILLVRETMERKGVQFVEQGAGGIPPMLLDSDRVKQVLLNILSNALSSTREGHTIRLRTRASEGWVQIEIANNGEKLPGEILEQLFVPFATAREGGCGLGLAVADQIVRQHGGEIRVRTSREWSVIFTVSLPIRTNQDRRQQPDRRGGRDRRRAA